MLMVPRSPQFSNQPLRNRNKTMYAASRRLLHSPSKIPHSDATWLATIGILTRIPLRIPSRCFKVRDCRNDKSGDRRDLEPKKPKAKSLKTRLLSHSRASDGQSVLLTPVLPALRLMNDAANHHQEQLPS
jgi:hypothetical protein